jgi:hypothetical protein
MLASSFDDLLILKSGFSFLNNALLAGKSP